MDVGADPFGDPNCEGAALVARAALDEPRASDDAPDDAPDEGPPACEPEPSYVDQMEGYARDSARDAVGQLCRAAGGAIGEGDDARALGLLERAVRALEFLRIVDAKSTGAAGDAGVTNG